MRYCVNCGFSYPDDARYCSRCGYILRSRQVSSPPATVNESRLSQPVVFVSPSSQSVSLPRPSSRLPSLIVGISFISVALLLAVIFFYPSLFSSFVGSFGSLGGKLGDLGGSFGSFAGELGGEFGRSCANIGGQFGGFNFHGSTLLRILLVLSILALFVIPGIFILFRSRRNNSTHNIRWE